MSSKATLVSTTESALWQHQDIAGSADSPAPNLSFTGETDQVWEGFGGCFNELGAIALDKLSDDDRAGVMHELFHPMDGCRFNYCRLPIGANDYAETWYSHNEHEGDLAMEHFSVQRDYVYLMPYIKAALAIKPDMKLFASPWSPPTWMKQPKAYNHGTLVWKPEYLAAYAAYFMKFIQAYAEHGIKIDQVHIQNEPNSDQKFPSCVWNGVQFRDFIRDYIGPMFRRNGIKTEIWAGTVERGDYFAWPGTILADETARAYVSGVGFQWAGKGAIQQTHNAWPQMRLLGTENECGDGSNSWDYAHYVFDLAHHYITNGINGYCYWNMVLEPRGPSTWGWTQNSMITIDPETRAYTYNPEFYVMKHHSNFIEPGAVRLGLTGQWAAGAVAFKNPDGKTVVIYHNPLSEEGQFVLDTGSSIISTQVSARSFNTLVVTED